MNPHCMGKRKLRLKLFVTSKKLKEIARKKILVVVPPVVVPSANIVKRFLPLFYIGQFVYQN